MIWLRNLFGTTTFRLALVYTLVFALSSGALFAFIFVNTRLFIEQQIESAIEAEIQAFQETFETTGLIGLIQAINRRTDPNFGSEGVYLLVGPNESRLAGNLTSWPQNVSFDDLWINFTIRDLRQSTEQMADVRALQLVVPGGFKLIVGRDIRSSRLFRDQLLRSLNLALGLTVAIGLVGGVLFSRSILGRIDRITRTCREIMRGDLTQRVPQSNTADEIGRLSGSINDMLDQIERLMTGMQQVSENIAHDLRTPLSRLRNSLEGAAASAKADVDRDRLEAAVGEADALLETFSALLKIARAEARLRRDFVEVDVAKIASEVCELYEPLAEEKDISLSIDVPGPQFVLGEPNLIAQALANLIDNGIKYTPAGGRVLITCQSAEAGKGPLVEVVDSGPGIPPEYRDKVLERLFRLEQSRTTPGSGLGLSLVAAVARSHGAVLVLGDGQPGLKVSIQFPQLSTGEAA